MATKPDPAEAHKLIEDLENFSEVIEEHQRIKMLAIALNYSMRTHPFRITATDLEELERILKQHYRP